MTTLAADFLEARLWAARGEPTRAHEILDALLSSTPGHLDALILKATLLLEARSAGEALAFAARAVESEPLSAEAWNAHARVLHALGRDVEAVEVARRAEALLRTGDNFRQTAPVYLTLVWCLRELRRYREALEAAERGLELMPDAVLAQWASIVEEEFAESQKEEC